MSYRRAERPAGSPTTIDDTTDSEPSRAELIEALEHLRKQSDIAYDLWRAARSREAAAKHKGRWESLLRHMDNLCEGIDMIDARN